MCGKTVRNTHFACRIKCGMTKDTNIAIPNLFRNSFELMMRQRIKFSKTVNLHRLTLSRSFATALFVFGLLFTPALTAAEFKQTFLMNKEHSAYEPIKSIPNDKGGKTIIGKIYRGQLNMENQRRDAMFIADFIPSETNPDSLILNWSRDFVIDDTTLLNIWCHTILYRKENGNIVIITSNFFLQILYGAGNAFFAYQTPYVIEYDEDGNLIHSYWNPIEDYVNENFACISGYANPILLHSDKSFSLFNGLGSMDWADSLLRGRIIVRHFDSLGYFQGVSAVKNIDTTIREFEDIVIGTGQYEGFTYITYNAKPILLKSNKDAIYLVVERNDQTPVGSGSAATKNNYTDCILKLNSKYEVQAQYYLPSLHINNVRRTSVVNDLLINNKGELIVLTSNGLSKQVCDNWFYQNGTEIFSHEIIILDTSDLSFINSYGYVSDGFSDIKQLENGKYVGAGTIKRNPFVSRMEYNYYGTLISEDFSAIKEITNPNQMGFDNKFNFVDILPDGRFEFWGRWSYNWFYNYPNGISNVGDDQIVRLVVSEDDFVDNGVEIKITSIEEIFLPTELNSKTFPNPTDAFSTLTVDLETAGHLTVSLTNILGQEIMELHNGFASAGTFTRTFSIETLPRGVYYLKIFHNGNVKVEKIVRE